MHVDYVVVVCSESYWKKCYDTYGKGVTWEINMVYQRLYDEHCDSKKYIPVIWNEEDDQYILLPLRPYTHYNIGTDEGYEGLKRHIKGIPKYAKATCFYLVAGTIFVPRAKKACSGSMITICAASAIRVANRNGLRSPVTDAVILVAGASTACFLIVFFPICGR